jgi:hypothetical protein
MSDKEINAEAMRKNVETQVENHKDQAKFNQRLGSLGIVGTAVHALVAAYSNIALIPELYVVMFFVSIIAYGAAESEQHSATLARLSKYEEIRGEDE